ncbi:MAG: Transferase hexapeptide repeat containing protein [Candidatus Curtissbacteria bacterium GW2011_GWA1_41_11]|uniref:Transferase hexapeptide repeat containing protein n=1 Tax=Candidatus Curtissbacteria bacterium GW2011_GWA1_41_11 TaxID=1618409 RepID=A0A0G0UH35_9BACT|nr:MAG: Transferase hexapeptide repeat containing protein [Candidatus Curtissbacteria bacterium GW2011_GWA1_41_11]
MNAIREVGIRKIYRFIIYSFIQVIYHILIDHFLFFPQCRKLFLVILGSDIGSHSVIMNVKFFNIHQEGPSGLTIGKECFIGDETLIDLYDKVILEDQVTIAQRVTILTHTNVGYKNHPLQKFFPKSSKPVKFAEGSVMGACSVILPGVTIGKESFIAAGSVVTKNVPSRTLVAGIPAKFVKKIK